MQFSKNFIYQIFQKKNPDSENLKISSLLQHTNENQLVHLQEIIAIPNERQPFTRARNHLVSLYGKSEEQKLDQLLAGANFSPELKPSLVLQEIRRFGKIGQHQNEVANNRLRTLCNLCSN